MTFEKLGTEIGKLVAEKNLAYGDSVAKSAAHLEILFPEGIPVEKYGDAALIIRVLDKPNRIADGDKKAFEESPWRDCAGYGILGYERDQREK